MTDQRKGSVKPCLAKVVGSNPIAPTIYRRVTLVTRHFAIYYWHMKTTQRGFIVPLLLVIIALLFVGGGAYVYTQQSHSTQSQTVTSATASLIIDPKTVKVGDVFGSWVVSSIEPSTYDSIGTRMSGAVNFTGTVTLHGRLSEDTYVGIVFAPDSTEISKLPFVDITQDKTFELDDGSHQLYDASGNATSLLKSLAGKEVTIEIKDFHLSFSAGSMVSAQFVRSVQ